MKIQKPNLEEQIKQKFEDMPEQEQQQYLEESFEFHKKAGHFHLFMANRFADQLGYEQPEE